MIAIRDVEHLVVDRDEDAAHCYNQVNVRRVRSGELIAVYNEEPFPFHHDSGQTVLIRSSDGGASWTDRKVGGWPMPGGEVLLGVYGRIRGYGEEGEGETTRSALLRSDDGGENREYFSTMAFDAASMVDYEEPAIVRLADGGLLGILRTHVNPSGDAKNMAMVVSDDDGFSWTPPRFTRLWGYPAELVTMPDGRILMVYGYRRPPYGVRGCVSDDGLTWDPGSEFTIREGGVPTRHPRINWGNPGGYQHIGYPSATVLDDGTVVCLYHEWTDDDRPSQVIMGTRFRLGD